MRIGECFNKSQNKNNKQLSFTVKKKKLKDLDISIEEIMNLKLNPKGFKEKQKKVKI